jgi:hypothetical protein
VAAEQIGLLKDAAPPRGRPGFVEGWWFAPHFAQRIAQIASSEHVLSAATARDLAKFSLEPRFQAENQTTNGDEWSVHLRVHQLFRSTDRI